MQSLAQDQSKAPACPTDGKEKEKEQELRSAEEGDKELNSEPEAMEAREEEAEFNWQERLEELGAVAAPHTAFKHVEVSLRSSFQPGMKLEVANKGAADTYWVATVVATCGQLLLLRFSGYGDDRRADFWCDVMTAELHPVGWCVRNRKTLRPPQAIREKRGDWTEFLVGDLTGSRTAPANLLEGPLRGKNTVDLIVRGSVLEVRDAAEPFLYWPARVIRNVGGRLRLRLAGLSDEHGARDVWLFYLDVRLRPLGWAQENRLALEPPAELRPLKSAGDWERALEDARRDGQTSAVPPEVFKDHADLPAHAFKVGMKLEMVSPWERLRICPVSVTKVFDDNYFQVTADDPAADGEARSALRHAASPGIMPIQWCLKNGAGPERPRGDRGRDLDRADYLKRGAAEAAPDACFPDTWRTRAFAKDTWLEAAHPERPAEICVAQITQVRGRLLWLRLEGALEQFCETIADVESMDIFPVGWCEANAYPLNPPFKPAVGKQRKIAVVQPEKQSAPSRPVEAPAADHCQPPANDAANGRYCCSKVFVNHRCFSGPYLNKGRIAELPQTVGPGKCTLVLKEVSEYRDRRFFLLSRFSAEPRGASRALRSRAPFARRRPAAPRHAHQRRLQARPRPQGAAGAGGSQLGLPGGDFESQVQRENVPLQHQNRPPGRPHPGLLSQSVRQAAVLPQPRRPRARPRKVPRELLCADQDQIHLLLWEEKEAAQAARRRGRGGGRAAQAQAQEAQEHLCAEEAALFGGGLHDRRLGSGKRGRRRGRGVALGQRGRRLRTPRRADGRVLGRDRRGPRAPRRRVAQGRGRRRSGGAGRPAEVDASAPRQAPSAQRRRRAGGGGGGGASSSGQKPSGVERAGSGPVHRQHRLRVVGQHFPGAGHRRPGHAAADAAHRAGVHGPEARARHQTVPPH